MQKLPVNSNPLDNADLRNVVTVNQLQHIQVLQQFCLCVVVFQSSKATDEAADTPCTLELVGYRDQVSTEAHVCDLLLVEQDHLSFVES